MWKKKEELSEIIYWFHIARKTKITWAEWSSMKKKRENV